MDDPLHAELGPPLGRPLAIDFMVTKFSSTGLFVSSTARARLVRKAAESGFVLVLVDQSSNLIMLRGQEPTQPGTQFP